MKRVLIFLGAALVLLLAVLAFNTARLPAPEPVAAGGAVLPIDTEAVAARLSRALQLRTVSPAAGIAPDPVPLAAFARLLAKEFPAAHAALERESIGPSLLYAWPGSDLQARPILLAAHFDVVPVEPGTEERWSHPPFGGVIADGFIWGRGALDDKSSLLAQMEAIERLAAAGWRPRRTVYFAYGHDEESGGSDGAKRIAATLAARGVHLEFTLDEGGAVTQGIVPGIAAPVASVMAGEKGFVSFRLTAKGGGGHSSTPPPVTAIGRVSRAIARIEASPMPQRLVAPVARMLRELAPRMGLASRVAIANRWLFEPLLLRQLGASVHTNALTRTTAAATVFHAGIKDNVLPAEAYAIVNFRLLPGDTAADAERYLRETIADDAIEIRVEAGFGAAAPPLSDVDTPAFQAIARSVREVFPEAIVASGIILATTDNRHYAAIRDNAYYFAPFPYTPDDEGRIHGSNERIQVQAYADMIRFYLRLLENAAS